MELIPHSFEAGRRGKPDELDSMLAHTIGARLLTKDCDARFDLDVTGRYHNGRPLIRIGGEVSAHLLDQETEREARTAVQDHFLRYYADEPHIAFEWTPQEGALAQNGNAGDSGHCIAVATTASPTREPLERSLALTIRDRLDDAYHTQTIPGLQADGKVQVDMTYNGGTPTGIESVIVAAEHAPSLHIDDLRHALARIVDEVTSPYDTVDRLLINGLGAWHDGGWRTDSGSRHAKPYRDGFGTHGCNEDSLSGEDPSKPGPTGSYLARFLANSIIDAGLADYARVHLRYAIGTEEVGLHVVTLGTGKRPQQELEAYTRKQVRGLRVKDATQAFGLRDPAVYERVVAASDHFHDQGLPWNAQGQNVRV